MAAREALTIPGTPQRGQLLSALAAADAAESKLLHLLSPLIRHAASAEYRFRQQQRWAVSMDDLIQDATLATLQGLRRYVLPTPGERGYGGVNLPYLRQWMTTKLRRTRQPPASVPLAVMAQAQQVGASRSQLRHTLGREPTAEEIAASCVSETITAEQVNDLAQILDQSVDPQRLEQPPPEGREPHHRERLPTSPSPSDAVEAQLRNMIMRDVITAISATIGTRDSEGILAAHFLDATPTGSIAHQFGIPRTDVDAVVDHAQAILLATPPHPSVRAALTRHGEATVRDLDLGWLWDAIHRQRIR